jgi:predicted DNA-binding transcriptional regulator YafY
MGRPNEHERIARVFSVLHLLKKDQFYSFYALGRLMGSDEKEAYDIIELLSTIDMEEYRPPFFTVNSSERLALEAGEEPEDIEEEEDPIGIWVWDDFHPFDQPFNFSRAEALALNAVLDYMGAQPKAPLRQKISSYLFGMTADEPETRILIDVATHEQHMSRLSYLVEHAQPARIVYRPQGATENQTYLIEPHRVYANRLGDWYVDAFLADDPSNKNTGQLRTFRIDRIASIEEMEGKFRRRPSQEEPFFKRLEQAPIALIEMDIDEPVEEREWPCSYIVHTEDERKTLAVPFLDKEWLMRRIIGKMGRVSILEPVSLQEDVRQLAALMARDASTEYDVPAELGEHS